MFIDYIDDSNLVRQLFVPTCLHEFIIQIILCAVHEFLKTSPRTVFKCKIWCDI